LPLLQKVKNAYLLWYGYYQAIPKPHRHSLGQRVDTLFVEIMETIASASFRARDEKRPYVRFAIRKVDTLKVLLMVLWETKSLENKKYAALSAKVEEIGKMLGGWNGQLTSSTNSYQAKLDPDKKRGEK
jgi:IS1 family transposase